MKREYKAVSSGKKRAENPIPFNHDVPEIFNPELQRRAVSKELAIQIKCLAALGDDHTSAREWRDAYKKAERQLMEECWIFRRVLGNGEYSQLMWLKEAGHWDWFAEKHRVRSRMDLIMNKYNEWYAPPPLSK